MAMIHPTRSAPRSPRPWPARRSDDRFCCDGKCLQRNASQGGSCPLEEQRDERAQGESWIYILVVFALCVVVVGLVLGPEHLA